MSRPPSVHPESMPQRMHPPTSQGGRPCLPLLMVLGEPDILHSSWAISLYTRE